MVWLPLTKMYFVLQNVGKHWRNMLRIHEFNSMYIIHVCLFVCMLFFIPLEDCSLMWKYFCQWGAANLDLSSTIAAIAKWEFFNVPQSLGSRSNDMLHLPKIWQWKCLYLFYWFRSVWIKCIWILVENLVRYLWEKGYLMYGWFEPFFSIVL